MSRRTIKSIEAIPEPEEARPGEHFEIKNQIRAERQALLDEEGELPLATKLAKITADPTRRVPHMNEMLEAIISEWGGSEAIARALHEEFLAAKAGSSVRTRMLEKLIDLMKINTQMFGAKGDDLDTMNEDDLRAFIMEEFGGQNKNSDV